MKSQNMARVSYLVLFNLLIQTLSSFLGNPLLLAQAQSATPATQANAATYNSPIAPGTIFAWGANQFGELANITNTGTTTPNFSPRPVSLPGVTFSSVAAGNGFSLAATNNGKLYGWGSNQHGQLGNSTNISTTTPNSTPTQLNLPGLPPTATLGTIAAGSDFGLAATSDGKLYGWGSNQYGQLGNSTNVSTTLANPTPTLVTLAGIPATATITSLAAGRDFSLAATSDGKLYGWGSNQYGQLGNSTNVSTTLANPTPAQISLPGLSPTATITSLAAGNGFSLATTSDGKLYGWGSNQYGQLANSTNVSTTLANPTPNQLSLPGLPPTATVTTIAAGYDFSLAATSDGKLYGWGSNQYGQLSNSTNISTTLPNSTPAQIKLLGLPLTATITSLAAGNGFSLAAANNGQVYGWGNNQYGQLGNTQPGPYLIPTLININIEQLTGKVALKSISLGATHSLLVIGDSLNTSWPFAGSIPLATTATGMSGYAVQYLAQPGASKWFRLPNGLNSNISVTLRSVDPASGRALESLPAQLDLSLYKDISLAYNSFDVSKGGTFLAAEAAPSGYLPSGYLPSGYLPSGYLPSGYLPSGYLPSGYLPSGYLPSGYLPSGYLPSGYLPSGYLPSGYLPSGYLSNQITPDPNLAPPPVGYQPERYSGVVLRSLLAVSAQEGQLPQAITRNSWDNPGDLYIQVRARPGQATLTTPFLLEVNIENSNCTGVSPVGSALPDFAPPADAVGRYQTLLLTDSSRLTGSESEKATLLSRLETLAARSEVKGLVIDLGAKVAGGNTPMYPRINQQSSNPQQQGANQIADAHPACPLAKNLVAQEIKKIIDSYQPQKYLVLAGPDNVIPFFRYPDTAGLANEKEYSPPVNDTSPAQAALRNGLVLSQDGYGASKYFNRGSYQLPLPGLAVGRLVDNAPQISHMVDVYLAASGVITPKSALVTGYDFVADTSQQVKQELSNALSPANCAAANNCVQPESLISLPGVGPEDKSNWTADQLRSKLLTKRNDIIFAAGHFSAGQLQAPDYSGLSANELAAAGPDYTNALFIGLGCHSGYNIPESDKLANGGSPDPDWPKALAKKGMSGLVGTGYQYGDTDFIQYSERLYSQFVSQLRSPANAIQRDQATGRVTVPIGTALVAAKRNYLTQTASLTGMDEKSLLIATFYGLPMLAVNLEGSSQADKTDPAIATQKVSSGPGQALGLFSTDLSLNGLLITPTTVTLTNRQDKIPAQATYYQGRDGTLGRPLEPLLPLLNYNVGVANTILRGVGLRSATYSDQSNVFPLITTPATELAPLRTTFNSPVFYPSQPWEINYMSSLVETNTGSTGKTQLGLSLAQYKSSQDSAGNFSPTGTLRRYSDLGLRLYYNADQTSQLNLAAAPLIDQVQVTRSPNGQQLNFQVKVAGPNGAGVQEVWVTYTSSNSGSSWHGRWQSLDLQPGGQTGVWQASLALPADTDPATVQVMAQVASGFGLVTLATNNGQYYTLSGNSTAPVRPTGQSNLTVNLPANFTAAYDGQPVLTATLTHTPATGSAAQPVANQPVTFKVGGQQITALTDSQGQARVNAGPGSPTFTLVQVPANYYLTVSFGGNTTYPATSASQPLAVTARPTALNLLQDKAEVSTANPVGVIASLYDSENGLGLGHKTVVFSATNGAATYYQAVQTDYLGRAKLGQVNWPAGNYTFCAYFGQDVGKIYRGLADNLYKAAVSCPANLSVTLVATQTQPTPGSTVSTPPNATPGATSGTNSGSAATPIAGQGGAVATPVTGGTAGNPNVPTTGTGGGGAAATTSTIWTNLLILFLLVLAGSGWLVWRVRRR